MNPEPQTIYRFHHLALSPLLSKNPLEAITIVKNTIQQAEEKLFLEFILTNGLGPLWHELIKKNKILSIFSPEFTRELRNITTHNASLYLFQQNALEKIEYIFTKHSIPYAIFKGVHTRELIYTNPAFRFACDIDILISKSDNIRAIKSLVDTGFTFHPTAENISHEATLTDSSISIDLHWDIMRPGRTRKNMTEEFITTRKKFPGHWGLNNEATLFLMLVHPVFTKYSTTPQAPLIRIIDLTRWITTQQIDWEYVFDYVEKGGVKAAAWITATWLKMLTGETLPASFMEKIKPSALRAWYLEIWLTKNLATRLLGYPVLLQTGFTLPAHDSLTDVSRFAKQILREKKEAEQNTKELLKSITEYREP